MTGQEDSLITMSPSRRDFIKKLGFGAAAVAATSATAKAGIEFADGIAPETPLKDHRGLMVSEEDKENMVENFVRDYGKWINVRDVKIGGFPLTPPGLFEDLNDHTA